jgi:putative modified peptide
MAGKGKGPAPAPLDPKVARKLLDLLSSDNDFRRLFKQDAHAALVKAGYKGSPGADPALASALSGGNCMQLKPGDRIAPKEKIARDRAKLEASLGLPVSFLASAGFKAD